jgi:protein-S-isoprenylcysteine O-methyltransferase Ste14
MWALSRWFPIVLLISPPWNKLGGIFLALGLCLIAAAFVHFRRAKTTVNPMDPAKASRLVIGGVFQLSRNPMYLGLVLLLVGWAVWLGTATAWLIPPLFIVVVTRVQIVPEERALERLFGAQYLAYRKSVARWIRMG